MKQHFVILVYVQGIFLSIVNISILHWDNLQWCIIQCLLSLQAILMLSSESVVLWVWIEVSLYCRWAWISGGGSEIGFGIRGELVQI